eukprot:2769794-Amphidinium_carterae.2
MSIQFQSQNFQHILRMCNTNVDGRQKVPEPCRTHSYVAQYPLQGTKVKDSTLWTKRTWKGLFKQTDVADRVWAHNLNLAI